MNLTDKNIKCISIKLILVTMPFLLVVIAYVITDPYRKLRNYEYYTFDYVMLHRGDIATRVFLKNKDKYHYDSFIFGSSRSCAHTARTWGKYLPSGSSPFSYGSWKEPIEGIYRKMQLIDHSQSTIKNAFIILDVDYSFVQAPDITLNYDHYLISGQSRWRYYLNDFCDYFNNPRLVLTSIDYTIFKKQRFYMSGFAGFSRDYVNPITNDWGTDDGDSQISRDEYKKAKDRFYPRSTIQQYEIRKIDQTKMIVLKKISDLLKKHKTKYFIVIAPIYNQIKFHPDDMILLIKIFGKDNIYDYSGINCITNDIYNYYTDVKHYRKSVGKLIFGDIYHCQEIAH